MINAVDLILCVPARICVSSVIVGLARGSFEGDFVLIIKGFFFALLYLLFKLEFKLSICSR